MSGVRFRYVQLLVRDVQQSAKFYNEALGVPILASTENWIEFGEESKRPWFVLKLVDNESQTRAGYSPFLSFDVDDLDTIVSRSLMAGAVLDGPIKRPVFGSVGLRPEIELNFSVCCTSKSGWTHDCSS
jgi:catechol 2,3-dioxygenase-like lactoylglutathione lyase family enzyme